MCVEVCEDGLRYFLHYNERDKSVQEREREREHSSTSALALTVAKHSVLMDAQNQPALNKSLQLIHTKDCCCFIHYDALVCICSLCFLMWCLLTWVCVCVCISFQVVSVSADTGSREDSSSDASLLKTDKQSDSRERDGLQERPALSKQGESTHTYISTCVCVCNILTVSNAHTQAHIYNNQKTHI